jgi:hypothetical protein
MLGQVVYHLLSAAHATRAPWPVVVLVSCLPVLTLGFGAALTHHCGFVFLTIGGAAAIGSQETRYVTYPLPQAVSAVLIGRCSGYDLPESAVSVARQQHGITCSPFMGTGVTWVVGGGALREPRSDCRLFEYVHAAGRSEADHMSQAHFGAGDLAIARLVA